MSYANCVLGSIPFGTLIGAPMTAAVEAQALAAQSSIDFIRSVGFISDGKDKAYGDVRNVTLKLYGNSFSYTQIEKGDLG